MQAFQKDLKKFERLNAQVLGISPDTIDTHTRFAAEYKISFPLLSDPDNRIKNTYGTGRITFIIDRDGVVRYIEKGVPKNRRLLKKLKSLEKER
jgi:peroxiredoxin Q/BCP